MRTQRIIYYFIIVLCLLFYLVSGSALADSKPVITTQPCGVEVSCYMPFSLTTEASGGSLNYQWQYRTEGNAWTDWRNMTTASITPSATPEMNDWEIRCIVSNSAGNTVSDTVRVSALPRMNTYNWPSLTKLVSGETVVLRVNGYGQDVQYQWYLSSNGRAWEKWDGQTGPVCTFVASSLYNGKYVDCRITDKHGHMMSLTDNNSNYKITVTGDITCEEEKTIYYLEETDVPYIGSIPAGYLQQLDYSGQEIRLLEGETVTVEDGVVKPKRTVWYWYNGMGTTWPRNIEGEVARTEYESGDSVISVNGRNIKVHVVDYSKHYADQVITAYIQANITSGMTDHQKMVKICEFICAREYSVHGQSWVSLVVTGGGDCWASTSTILYMANKVGIEAMQNDERGKNGAGSGHMNAVALLDGQYCVVEAGYYEPTPRGYSITRYGDPFDCNLKSSTEAGINAFMNFDNLSEIEIPSQLDGRTVTSIDYRAFSSHTELTSVVIPNTVTSIKSQAFLNCSGLETIMIPASVTSLESDAFYGCESLTAIQVAESNPSYQSIDGVVFSKDGTNLVAFPGGRTGTYTVPSGVTAIKAFSFSNASLDCVILPESMEAIGENAFASSYIRSFVLPKRLKRIEQGAFYRAEAKAYVLPQGLEYIGVGAFSSDSNIWVNIPASVTEIGDSAFRYCSYSLIWFAPGCDPAIGENAFQSAIVSVAEGTGPWQYANDNNVTIRLQNGNGKIPLQGEWFALKNNTFTCTGRPIDFLYYLKNQSDMPLRAGCDYRVSVSESIRPGAGKLTITGIGNYTGSTELDYTIRFFDTNGDRVIDSKDLIQYWYDRETLRNTLVLPDALNEIESGAFAGVHPRAVIFPKGVQTISEDAFDDNGGMIVVIPDESWIPWAARKGYDYRINID